MSRQIVLWLTFSWRPKQAKLFVCINIHYKYTLAYLHCKFLHKQVMQLQHLKNNLTYLKLNGECRLNVGKRSRDVGFRISLRLPRSYAPTHYFRLCANFVLLKLRNTNLFQNEAKLSTLSVSNQLIFVKQTGCC